MATYFFLTALPIIAFFIKGNDRAPALAYCLAVHSFVFIASMAENPATIYAIGGVTDVFIIAMLLCFNGCLRSRLVYFLIPLSLVSIAINARGFYIVANNIEGVFIDEISIFYMMVVVALFIYRAGRYGDSHWDNRFLNRDDARSQDVGALSK